MMTIGHLKSIRRAQLIWQVRGRMQMDPSDFDPDELAEAYRIWGALKGIPMEEREDMFIDEIDKLVSRSEALEGGWE